VTVTTIDANHCPGAAMFLFEGRFGRILYTGDFRYCGPMLNDIQLNSLSNGSVDVLYLDNTFCHPQCIFPSRKEAVVEIINIIQSHPEAQIKIALRSLGKEQMLVNIAHSMGEWIGVSQDRYEVLELLCMPDVFQVSSSCRIQVVMMSEITGKRMMNWNSEQETLAIIPTAIHVALNHSAFPQRDDIYVVPYSDHSSYEELQQFVSFIEPRKIYPILGPNVDDRLARSLPGRADMSCFCINVDDDCQEHAAGSSVDIMLEQRASVNSSYNSDMNKSATETCYRTRKRSKRNSGFSIKKKEQMGVVFFSSQSPTKRSQDVTLSPADSVGVTADQSEAEIETPTKVVHSDTADDVCDKATDVNEKEGTLGNYLRCSSNQFSSATNDWMLQVVQPLIEQEADKIILERQSFSRQFHI